MINRHFIFICLVCILILVLYFVSLENNKEYFFIPKLTKFHESMKELLPRKNNWENRKDKEGVNIDIIDLKLKELFYNSGSYTDLFTNFKLIVSDIDNDKDETIYNVSFKLTQKVIDEISQTLKLSSDTNPFIMIYFAPNYYDENGNIRGETIDGLNAWSDGGKYFIPKKFFNTNTIITLEHIKKLPSNKKGQVYFSEADTKKTQISPWPEIINKDKYKDFFTKTLQDFITKGKEEFLIKPKFLFTDLKLTITKIDFKAHEKITYDVEFNLSQFQIDKIKETNKSKTNSNTTIDIRWAPNYYKKTGDIWKQRGEVIDQTIIDNIRFEGKGESKLVNMTELNTKKQIIIKNIKRDNGEKNGLIDYLVNDNSRYIDIVTKDLYPNYFTVTLQKLINEYKDTYSLLKNLNIQNNIINIFQTYSIEIDRNYNNIDDKYTKIKFKIKQELKEDIKKAIKYHNSIATDMFDYNNYRVKLLYNYRNSNTIDFVSNNFTIKDIDRSFDYKNNYTGEEIKEDIIKNNLVYPTEIKIVDEKNPVDWNIPYDLDNKTTHGHRKTTNKHRSKYFKKINITRMGYNTMDIEVLISQDLMLALDNASRNSDDGKGYDNNKITFDWKDESKNKDESVNIVKADTKITINDADDLKKIGILKFKNIKTDTKFNHIFIYKKSNHEMWNFRIKYENDPELKNCLNILNISNIQRTNIKTKINTEFKNIFTESFPETIKYYQKTKEYENSYFTIQEVTCIYDIENIEVFRPSGSNSKRDNNLKYYPFKIILKPNEQLKKAIEQHTTPQKDLIMKYNMGKPLLIKVNSEVILEKPVIIRKDNYTFYIKIDKILIQKTPNYINSINILLDNYSGTYLHKKWVTFQIVNGGYNFINDKYTKELFCSINKKICVEINRVKYPSNTKFKDNECYYPCKGYPGCLDTPSKICK